MSAIDVLWVGVAGSAGAMTRLLVDVAVRSRTTARIPLGTLVVNVTGSFLFGVLSGLVIFHGAPSTLTLVAGAGFCGGYTTFSGVSFESVRLLQEGETRGAIVIAGANMFCCLGAAALGLSIVAV